MKRWWAIPLGVLVGGVVHLTTAHQAWPPQHTRRMRPVATRGAEPWPLPTVPDGFPPLAAAVSEYRRGRGSREVRFGRGDGTIYTAEHVN